MFNFEMVYNTNCRLSCGIHYRWRDYPNMWNYMAMTIISVYHYLVRHIITMDIQEHGMLIENIACGIPGLYINCSCRQIKNSILFSTRFIYVKLWNKKKQNCLITLITN